MLEKQQIPKNYDLEEQNPQEEKQGTVKKVASFADLIGDFTKFLFGSKKHGKEVRDDIINIEKQRLREKEKLAKEREKREKMAKKKALDLKDQELLSQQSDREKIDERRRTELNLDRSVNHLIQQKAKPDNGDQKINFLENFNDDGFGFEQAIEIKHEDKKPKKAEPEMIDHNFKIKEKKAGLFAWLKQLFQQKPKKEIEKKPEEKKVEVVEEKPHHSIFSRPKKLVIPELKNVNLDKISEPQEQPKPEQKPEPEKKATQPVDLPEMPPSKVPETHDSKVKATQKFLEERMKLAKDRERSDVEERPWHAYNIIKANLIKDQQFMFFNWQRKILALILYVFFAILFSATVYGGLIIWDNQKKQDNQGVFDNLDNINNQIVREQPKIDEILAFSDRLSLVSFILDNHIYWSEFFKFLEDYTLKTVYYEEFSGDLSGSYEVKSVAKDFDSIYRQLKLMQMNDQVTSVDTQGAKTAADGSVITKEASKTEAIETEAVSGNKKFIMSLSVDRKIFLKLTD